MPSRSANLIEVGREYLHSHAPPQFVASTTGGSVARNEADEFSDLDINIYVDGGDGFSANRSFAGETIQIHVHPFPTLADVKESPWGYRFLREAGVVLDPTGRYESFARDALFWLDSPDGRSAARSGARRDVSSRREWAERSIRDGDRLESGMASVAAMTDAAMLYRAIRSGSMACGCPLTDLGQAYSTQPDVPWKKVRLEDAEDLLEGFAAYRQILADRHEPEEDFVLDEVQVDMRQARPTDSPSAPNLDRPGL